MSNQATPSPESRTFHLPGQIIIWFKLILLGIGLTWAARILLMAANPTFRSDVSAGEAVVAWLIGVRFDLATTFIILTIPFLPLWVPLPVAWGDRVARVAKWLVIAFFGTAVLVLVGDVAYYQEAGRHITFEIREVAGDKWTMLKETVIDYSLWWLVGIVSVMGIGNLVSRIFASGRFGSEWTVKRIATNAGISLLALGLSALSIRGGFQPKPLRMAFAYQSDNLAAGHLALNGVYTFVTSSFSSKGKHVSLMPDSTAFEITRKLVASDFDNYVDPKYPLLREAKPVSPIAAPGEKLNVVLIVVESLTAANIKSFGGELAMMPFLDSLGHEGVIFDNCYAVGIRSIEGLPAILASAPNLATGTFMGGAFEQNKVRGLGSIFREQGYHTSFIHAAAPGSVGVEQLAVMTGYEQFYDKKDFSADQDDGIWGIWDKYSLKKLSDILDATPEPVHGAIFTLSTHPPFPLPKEVPTHFPDTKENKIANSFANLDDALRTFFQHEATQERFKRTLYAIIGDHVIRWQAGSTEFHYRIGCVLYAPGRLKPQVISRPVSQLDMIPTLIYLTGVNTLHASYGRSMFETDSLRATTYSTNAGLVGWRHGNRFLWNDLGRDIRLTDPKVDGTEDVNYLDREPETAIGMRRELYGFYQTVEDLYVTNRIYPATKGELEKVGR